MANDEDLDDTWKNLFKWMIVGPYFVEKKHMVKPWVFTCRMFYPF